MYFALHIKASSKVLPNILILKLCLCWFYAAYGNIMIFVYGSHLVSKIKSGSGSLDFFGLCQNKLLLTLTG